MFDPILERKHLAKADLDIAEGEMRITKQMIRIEMMRQEGFDITEAEKFLGTLQETLAVWQEHREDILRSLAQHEARSS